MGRVTDKKTLALNLVQTLKESMLVKRSVHTRDAVEPRVSDSKTLTLSQFKVYTHLRA